MAWLLKYNLQYQIINPTNTRYFIADEVMHHIKNDDYCIYQLRGHDKKNTPYKIAYNPALMGDFQYFNYLATRTILKPEFTPSEYTAVNIQLRTAPKKVFERYKNLTFIGGYAIVGTTKELLI